MKNHIVDYVRGLESEHELAKLVSIGEDGAYVPNGAVKEEIYRIKSLAEADNCDPETAFIGTYLSERVEMGARKAAEQHRFGSPEHRTVRALMNEFEQIKNGLESHI